MFNSTLGKIIYTNNDEYRTSIAKIFGTPDEEYLDDEFSFEPVFDSIYEQTCNDAFFKWAYVTAAGFMLSEDDKLGVCVLFAYDYAAAFYDVLCDYLNGDVNNTLANHKETLEKILSRKYN